MDGTIGGYWLSLCLALGWAVASLRTDAPAKRRTRAALAGLVAFGAGGLVAATVLGTWTTEGHLTAATLTGLVGALLGGRSGAGRPR